MSIIEFVTEKHKNQVRKYTGEPYINHLLSVASYFEKYSVEWYIALCHDLLEDTDCTTDELINQLKKDKLIRNNIAEIYRGVKDLTDYYTKVNFPELNREERKSRECLRLSKISSSAMSVKYADLIDNLTSIAEYDKKFAMIYLQEKYEILKHCRQGDFNLYYKAIITHNRTMLQLYKEQGYE